MGYAAPSLHRYIAGSIEPGKKFFDKLLKDGCDLNWLLTEESINPVGVSDVKVEYSTSISLDNDYKTKYERLLKKVKGIIEEEGNK